MEFLKNLGFDPIMLGAQILNFLIIFYLLKRFLYKPVMDMIKKREDKITQGLKQAEVAAKTLEKALEDEKKILSKAQSQSQKIIEEARLQAGLLSAQIEESARAQTQKLISDAHSQIAQETLEAERRISEKTSDLAREILLKSLTGVFSQSEQKKIVEKAIKNIKKTN
ncbi:MAG: F0F1 ATP synthase subunit B [Candidatus Levybacteria bacterium]|nr:F0F1 ATP synthase subunit B [Candidatus Levybacteria bacterium]